MRLSFAKVAVAASTAVILAACAMPADDPNYNASAAAVDPAMPGKIREYTRLYLAEGPHRDADQAALLADLYAEAHAQRIAVLDAWVRAAP